MKKRCQFQGGAGLAEKYRPGTPCQGEFLQRPCNEPRQKYCKACAPFAKKWLSAQNANARYKATPQKFAKITRENRWKRRKTAGRPCARIGVMVGCKYRDRGGKRGKGCLRKFERKSSSQKFCAVCQKHADADRAHAYRDAHPEKEKQRQAARWKTVRHDLAALRELKTGAASATHPKPAKSAGRKIEKMTEEKIALVARLEADGLTPYRMTDLVYPPGLTHSKTKMPLTRHERFHRLEALIKYHRERINLAKQKASVTPLTVPQTTTAP